MWWHEIPKPARAVFVCGIPIASTLAFCDAYFNDSLGPERPLSAIRLLLRLGCIFACAVSFAIAGVGLFREKLRSSRLRQGFCPTCGYDMRATPERCPECGVVPEIAPEPVA